MAGHGSMLFVFAWLALGGVGAPLPEDVALLATGALIERGAVSPVTAFAIVMLGVIGGDAILFFAARRLGPAALARRPFSSVLPPERRAKLEGAYRRWGGLLVVIARNVAGLRAATFALAGIAGMAPRRFLTWDALAACIGVPVVMWVGYAASAHATDLRAGIAAVQHGMWIGILAAVVVCLAIMRVRSARRRAASSSCTV